MRHRWVVGAAFAVVTLVTLVAVFGSLISPEDPNDGDLISARSAPSSEHWLGTDYLGRDVLSRIIAGSRVAMIAGVEATAVALIIGAVLGMSIGLAGGWVDRVAMRTIEGVSAIPALVLAIAIIAALGAGLTRSMFAVGIAFAMSMTRLVRGLTLAERERLYVDGARVVGAGRRRLLTDHIAPNIAGPIAVQATLVFASAITIEAGLSYLGLGVQPPNASWGSMLAAAQRTVRESPFQAIPPGAAIVLTVLSINILGDAAIRRRRGAAYDHPTGYLEPTTVQRDAHAPSPNGSAVEPSLLRARHTSVRYGDVTAVSAVDLEISPGEVVALVGESGSGKTSLSMALAGLLAPPAVIEAGSLSVGTGDEHIELAGADAATHERWRTRVGVVFQEPSASLNPLQTIGRQLGDVIRAQRRAAQHTSTGTVQQEIVRLLDAVGLPRPDEIARLRPGQISGGMAQRVVLALALAKDPDVLIADEPTTALDVTVQAEIIKLIRTLCRERRFGVLLVTHDLGVAGELADRCLVMFRGRIVETAPIAELIRRPRHPYTAALIAAVPRNEPGRAILTPPSSIDLGVHDVSAPDEPDERPTTHRRCGYVDRCPHAEDRCHGTEPLLLPADSTTAARVACLRVDELALAGAVQDGATTTGPTS